MSETAVPAAAALGAALARSQQEYYGTQYPWSADAATSNWVTNLVHECPRYGLLARRVPAPRPEARVLAMMQQGREMEAWTVRRLLAWGWSWSLAQLRLRWDAYDLTGRMDGVLHPPGGGPGVVAEVKAISAPVWQQITREEDFAEARYWRHRAIPWQLRAYLWMVAEGLEQQRERVLPGEGLVILVDKGSGAIRPVAVHIEGYEDGMTALLDRAAAVNAALERGGDLPRLERPSVCLECEYQTECMPSLQFPAPLLAGDETFQRLLVEREESAAERSRYERADREIKRLLSQVDWGGSDTLIAGDFTITRRVNKVGAVRHEIVRHKEAEP